MRRAFVAFSGGGAKGIAHIGALKALEKRNVRLLGLAGTSAGAIVAVLAAAGFRADDMVHGSSGATIINELQKIDVRISKARHLFGRGGWFRIRMARLILGIPLPIWVTLAVAWFVPVALFVLVMRSFPSAGLDWLLAAWIFVGAAAFYLYRRTVGGLSDVKRFRNALATLLQQKMFPEEPGRVVLMSDFGKNRRPALKIVSANITKKRLELFSAERTGKVPAADAVAASICLPFIFSPWNIGEDLHVDGGIVSNLPAWPFDEERELDPEAITISVEIESNGEDARPPGRHSWISHGLNTALFGSAELNHRVSGPAERLVLTTSFGLLDFNKSAADSAAEIAVIEERAGVQLDKSLFKLPDIYRDACKVTREFTLDALGVPSGGSGKKPRVRVALGVLERNYSRSLRLSHSVGYEDDPDEGMLLPIEGSIAGAAWKRGKTVVERAPLPVALNLPGAANRFRRKMRWADVQWVMCVPISDETGDPMLVVQIDGNMTLPRDAATRAALSGVEDVVREFFSMVMVELEDGTKGGLL